MNHSDGRRPNLVSAIGEEQPEKGYVYDETQLVRRSQSDEGKRTNLCRNANVKFGKLKELRRQLENAGTSYGWE